MIKKERLIHYINLFLTIIFVSIIFVKKKETDFIFNRFNFHLFILVECILKGIEMILLITIFLS